MDEKKFRRGVTICILIIIISTTLFDRVEGAYQLISGFVAVISTLVLIRIGFKDDVLLKQKESDLEKDIDNLLARNIALEDEVKRLRFIVEMNNEKLTERQSHMFAEIKALVVKYL